MEDKREISINSQKLLQTLKPIRVLYSRTLFLFNLKSGGSVGHTIGVLEGLENLAEVEIISNEFIRGAKDIPCQIVKPIGKSWWGEFIYNSVFFPRVISEIKTFQPDFVYHRYNGYSFATAKACRQSGVPLVLEFNSSDLWKLEYWASRSIKSRIAKPFKRLILKYTEPFNLEVATLIVVVSEPLQKELVSMGIPSERILVNPNAVDPEKFKLAHPRVIQRIKQELNVPPDSQVVGFSGTFGLWHGVPELAEAIIQLSSDLIGQQKFFFVLYGDGELRPWIERKVGHLSNVYFAGTIEYEKIQDYLSICDILLSPHGKTLDNREFFGSPTKLFEYMAMGKGIVASNLAQIGQVLEHKQTAMLVEPGNVRDLVQSVIYLSEHPDERQRLGTNARQVVVKRHTWDQNVKRVIQSFRRIKEYGTV